MFRSFFMGSFGLLGEVTKSSQQALERHAWTPPVVVVTGGFVPVAWICDLQ